MSSRATPGPSFFAWSNSGALVNAALAAVLFLGTLVLLLHSRSNAANPKLDFIPVLFAATSTIPLFWWRRLPVVVFAVIGAASVALAGIGYLLELPLGLTASLYLLTTSRRRDSPWNWRTTTLVITALATYLVAGTAGQRHFPAIVEFHACLVWAVAWFAGERTRLQNEHIVQLQERALAAERETERERELATAMERSRIARDLHDSAGHAISVIAVRAGAARLRHHQDPDRSLRALEAIEELARNTVQEIDQLVGTLREGTDGGMVVEAPPGLASLPALISQRSAAGLDAKFDISGTRRPLATAVDQAIYRIIQEALTNASRHGKGDATISLTFGESSIGILVTNLVQGSGKGKSNGHGLIGMRERATLLGGNFSAEHKDSTFVVHAQIPYGAESH